MTIKKTKIFFSYMGEEKWLNEMAQKGLHLVKYTFFRYHFEEDDPGKYEYRLEFLAESPKSKSSQEYLEFMDEAGVECVDTFSNWVYFRKEATDEPFEIYTDTESKLKHINRIIFFLGLVAVSNLFIGIANVLNDFPYAWLRFIPALNLTAFLALTPIIIKYLILKREIMKNR